MRRRFLLLVAVFAIASPAVAAPFVRGVDVSRWRGTIAWQRVAHGGYRFAFAEATNGFAVDPTFIRNRSGAKAARIAFAGFHFARPAGSTRSGVIANAVAAALGSLGVTPRELPLSPPRVWQLIRERTAPR